MVLLLKSICTLVRFRIILPLLAVIVVVYCWTTFRPRPLPLDERRLALAHEVGRKLAEALPVPPAGRPTLIVAPLERDPTGRVTDAVRRAIDRVDRYTVRPAGFVENSLDELGIRRAVSLEAAASAAMDDFESEYLVAGRVKRLSARSDADHALLHAVFVPVGSPDEAIHLSAEVVHDHAAKTGFWAMDRYPWPARLVGWLALVVLLPLAAAPLAVRGLRMKSNAINLAILLGLTSLAGLAAWGIFGFRLDSWGSAAMLIAAVVGSLVYNWEVLVKLEELVA